MPPHSRRPSPAAVTAHHPVAALLTVAALFLLPGVPLAEDLRSTLSRGGRLTTLADTAAKFVGRSLIVTGATAPVSYTFDDEKGTFVREQTIAGELYLERPRSIGKGHWNLAAAYQYYAFSHFDGRDLHDLSDVVPVVNDDGVPLVSIPDASIDLQAHQTTVSATYGLTDAIDLNLVVPILHTSLDRTDRVRLIGTPTTFREAGASAASTGIGDILLRGKIALSTTDALRVAAGLALRLPSGDPDDFQGTGSVDVQPSLFASSLLFERPGMLHIEAVLNAGMVFDTDDVDDSEGRWGAGLATTVGRWVALETAVLGRHAVDRLAPSGAFDLPRCLDGPGQCGTPTPARRVGPLPLFGFDGGRPDYFDFAIGTRVNTWRDTVFVFAGALIPLNDEGLRTDPAPAVGIEGSF